MSDLIEWEASVSGDVWWGRVAGRVVFTVVKPYPDADNHVTHWGIGNASKQELYVFDNIEATKTNAEKLLGAWLNEAGLVKKPVVNKCNCDRCTGDYLEKYYKDEEAI